MARIKSFRCLNPSCDEQFSMPFFEGCPRCKEKGINSNLYLTYELDIRPPHEIKANWKSSKGKGIWRFSDRLPDIAPENRITLEEGNTPLIPLKSLGKELGLKSLWIKDESRNPTWSWKDRMMSLAVSRALEAGAKIIAGSSTGNAGASLAAYASRAGLKSYIFACPPLFPAMKTMMQIYGAHLFIVPSRIDRFKIMEQGVRNRGWYPVTNFTEPPVGSNCFGLEGYKTLSYEIAEQLEFELPDFVVIPTSIGDGLCGIYRGFWELKELKLTSRIPKLVAVRPLHEKTVAISLGRPQESLQVRVALEESKGITCYIEEEDIILFKKELASKEGIFLEASSVVGICALKKIKLLLNSKVVVIGTSSGLKDYEIMSEHLNPPYFIGPKLEELDRVLASIQKISE